MLLTKKNKKGFTVIETLISSSLTMVMIGFTTGFLWFFNNYSNENIIKNNIQSDLRNVSERIEKEILPARIVLNSYTPPSGFYVPPPGSGTSVINSGPNRLIFTVPVYSKSTYLPATTISTDTNLNDVVILEYDCARSSSDLSQCDNNSTTKPAGRLKFWYIPAPGADYSKYNRQQAIHNHTILSYVANPLNTGVISQTSTSGTIINSYSIFEYRDINKSTVTDYQKTAMIKVNIFAKKEYGKRNGDKAYSDKKEIEVKLRNF